AVLAVPFWHAPALVHWAGQGAMQALFSSTLAVWRNRGAFAVYLLSWLAVMLGLSMLVSLLGSALGPQWMALMVPLGIALSGCFYASLYFSFMDSFVFSAVPDATSAPREKP
ncbi:MAG TPA: hypothetical protein VGE47_13060, partial [Burkholderiaceae bacterium]